MGKVFTTGTINQPDAGSVGTAMAEKIRDDVVAHAAWELVEEFTAASGTVRWYVFRCLTGVSGLPADYYVVIGRTLSTGELRFTVCENYTAGGDSMQFFPRRGGSGVTYDAQGRATDTQVLGTTALASGTNQAMYVSWIPSGTSTKWWLIVEDDGFTVAFNGPSNGFVHIGGFTPLTAIAHTMPVQIVGSSDSNGGITRNPAVAGIVSAINASALLINGGGATGVTSGGTLVRLGFQGDLRYNDKLQNNQRPVAEVGINVSATGGDQAQNGWALGKQKRMRVTDQAVPVGVAFGDAYELDGSLWVPYLPTDGRLWDTGVASS